MEEKSQSFTNITELIAKLERELNKQVKTLRSDRGGEFTGNNLESYLKSHGIRHKKTTPDTPQSNGAAERLN